MTKILMIAGTFGETEGKASTYMHKVVTSLMPRISAWYGKEDPFNDEDGIFVINGGLYQDLLGVLNKIEKYDAIWWFPNIPNHLPKIVNDIKDKVGNKVLVISKNNSDQKYTYLDLVARLFKARANLSLIIESPSPFKATVLDPLGNAYIHDDGDVSAVANALFDRTVELTNFSRARSISVGPAIETPYSDDTLKFIDIVKNYAETFHELVHGVNPSRFLGNASFRCTRAGFPAFRGDDNLIYISQRNLDKREIATDNFIPVQMNEGNDVLYYGDRKPSVDAPIQKELFRRLPWVNYMLHAHVYVRDNNGYSWTKSKIPCGALEEIDEVIDILTQDPVRKDCYKINLKGHGCLILGTHAAQFRNLQFEAREIPEIEYNYDLTMDDLYAEMLEEIKYEESI